MPPLPRPVAPQAEARSIAPAHPPRQQPSTPKRRHTIPACLDSDDSDAPPRPPKRARRPREHIYLRSATPSGSTPQAGSSARGSSSAASRLVPGTSRSSPSTEPEEPAARQQVQEEDIKPVVQEPQEPEREALTRVLGGSDMLDWLGNAVSADLTRELPMELQLISRPHWTSERERRSPSPARGHQGPVRPRQEQQVHAAQRRQCAAVRLGRTQHYAASLKEITL